MESAASKRVVVPGLVAPEGAAPERTLYFLFCEGRLLLRDGEEPDAVDAVPRGAPPAGLALGEVHFVATVDGAACVAANAAEGTTDPPAGYAWRGLRSLLGRWDEAMLAVAGRASQLAWW